MNRAYLTLLLLVALAAPGALATTVVIDDHFDDGTVTGWQSVGNVRTFSAHNITESGSVLSSEVVPTQSDTNRGIASTVSFNPSAESGGFTMTFVVASQGVPAPGANGFFLGAVTSNTVFFRDATVGSFGIVLFGTTSRTGSGDGLGFVVGDNNNTAAADFILDAMPSSIELASIQDGFTATLSADPVGWSYSVDGINAPGGAATTLANSGTWAVAGTDFASVFGSTTDWYVLASNQGPGAAAGLPTHTVTYDRITVATVPEPSALTVLALLGTALAGRRRRI